MPLIEEQNVILNILLLDLRAEEICANGTSVIFFKAFQWLNVKQNIYAILHYILRHDL